MHRMNSNHCAVTARSRSHEEQMARHGLMMMDAEPTLVKTIKAASSGSLASAPPCPTAFLGGEYPQWPRSAAF